MDKIDFVDQTLRDGQQSIWGFTMRTDMIEPIAETMDRVGYRAIATVGSQGATVEVRNLDEDPWERIRVLSRRMVSTPVRGSYQTGSLSSFDLSTPRDIITLWIKRSAANGIKSFWICDYQDDMERFRYFAEIAKKEGAEIVPALMYTTSPVHTSDHWALKTRLIASVKDCVDRIMIEDASGVMTPEGTRELVSVVLKNCDGIPVEIHSHCNTGLAPLCYLEAMKLGVRTFHTAVGPLANDVSVPALEAVLKNARRLGFESDVNEDALAEVSAHFRRVAEIEGLPLGAPLEHDLFRFEHQVPGGMMANLIRQLKEVGMEGRLEEFLEEIVRVRKELGYPVMATPYSQIVGAQAVENVVSGKRYGQISDELIKYALGYYGGPGRRRRARAEDDEAVKDGPGYYGEPVAPIDPKVVDIIMSCPRTADFVDWKREGYLKSVEDLRKEIGPDLSDDDLLLRILIPGRQLTRRAKKEKIAPLPRKTSASAAPADVPRDFSVDVDGEVFNVRITPLWEGREEAAAPEKRPAPTTKAEKAAKQPGGFPKGAVLSGMAGMVLSFEVGVGDQVNSGDLLAMIEAMKMRRRLQAPHGGVVKEICAQVGDIISAEDVLMVVA